MVKRKASPRTIAQFERLTGQTPVFHAPAARLEAQQRRGALYAVLMQICDNPDYGDGNRNIRIMEAHYLHGHPIKDIAASFGISQRHVTRVLKRVKEEAPRHRELVRPYLEPAPPTRQNPAYSL